MALLFLKTDADGRPIDAVRITDEPAFERHFLPFCRELGLRLLPRALDGFRVHAADILPLREEFTRLRDHVRGLWFFQFKSRRQRTFLRLHVPWACNTALTALIVAEDHPERGLYLLSSCRPQQAAGLPPFDYQTLLPLGEPVDFSAEIMPLFSLTSSSFEWDDLHRRCVSFGWTLDDHHREEADGRVTGYMRFDVAGRMSLMVLVGDEGGWPSSAFTYVYHYGDGGCGDGATAQAHYDGAFNLARGKLVAALGEPAASGEYRYPHRQDERPYRFATWTGEAGVLMLRQDEIDPIFGKDINLWVQPWKKAEPLPTPPLIL